jgi:hypothetical protein
MSTDDTNHKDIYIQLKAIFDGCDTILDAIPFSNEYSELYPHMKSMIISYMNGRTYRDTIDIKTKQVMIRDLESINNRDEAYSYSSKLTEKTTDDVYKKTLERLSNRKTYRKREQKIKDMPKYITKYCPHCSHAINMLETTQYVICGYQNPNQGYDWNGCGRDWCFQCGKMLCKRWETNSLCLQMNRYHDDDCCSKHSKETGKIYPDDYCQCNNMNIINSLILY